MTPLEHFEKRVKEHTLQLDSRTKDTALIWDLWCALQELRAEYDTLKDAYLRLMQGVEEKMEHRQPALGPLGMGSAEGVKNQAHIYETLAHFEKRVEQQTRYQRTKDTALVWDLWKCLHDELRAKYPDLPDLTPIMQSGDGMSVAFKTDKPAADIERGEVVDGPKEAKKEFGPDAPAEWFVWAIDRLREDSKDGNFHRSYRFAQELMTAIDDRGYAIVKKDPA